MGLIKFVRRRVVRTRKSGKTAEAAETAKIADSSQNSGLYSLYKRSVFLREQTENFPWCDVTFVEKYSHCCLLFNLCFNF